MPARRSPSRAASPTGANKVRIIGGQWKRTPLTVLDSPGLRPTPDRVRETLFNWLTHFFPDFSRLSFLDAFAGTGALGFEAASRGAARVLMVERDRDVAAQLRATQARLGATGVEIVAADATTMVPGLAGAFDVVLLDPPFGQGFVERCWSGIERALAPAGMVYVETESPFTPAPGFEIVRQGRAGAVHFHLLRRMIA